MRIDAPPTLVNHLSSEALFEDWISVREHASYEPLSRKSALPYKYIWKRWCDWLDEQSPPMLYAQASTQDVHQFLWTGASPASKRKARSTLISPVTRQRYGRVLKELYQHAVNFGHLTSNPVTLQVIGMAPTTVERGGQILPPRVFEALYDVFPVEPTPYVKRDKAILFLILECALKAGELRNLQIDDVREDAQHPGQFLLRIDGPRGAQQRNLLTTGPAGQALHDWLIHRKAMQRNTEVVFISEKRGAMTKRALFGMVSQLVIRACQMLHVDVPNHIGPMVVRNACIVRWYNMGKPIDEICLEAGYKDEKSFLRGLGVHLKARCFYSDSNLTNEKAT
jgi:site-specific recombinase XerD